MLFTTISLLSALCAFAAATPTPVQAARAADPTVTVNMYSSDTCGGDESSFTLVGSGSYRCVAVTNKRSISVPVNSGCTVETWSGSNCGGSHYKVPDNACHSVLYAGVSVSC